MPTDAGELSFDQLFAEAAAEVAGGTKPAEEPNETPNEEPSADATPAEEPKEEPKEEPQSGETEAEVKARAEAEAKAKVEAEAAAKAKADAEAAEAAAKAKAAAEAAQASDKEYEEAFSKFAEDWPEHAEALRRFQSREQARLEKEKAEIRESILAEVNQMLAPLGQQLQPFFESAEQAARAAHNAEITTAHPDAFDLIEPITQWIAQQPETLKGAMSAVIESGTAQEVVHLIGMFKQATGKAGRPVSTEEPGAGDDISEKASHLRPVKSRRSTIGNQIDPNDFDGAFAAAAAAARS